MLLVVCHNNLTLFTFTLVALQIFQTFKNLNWAKIYIDYYRYLQACDYFESALTHPAGTSVNSVCFWADQSILTRFYNGGLWENIFWSIHKNNIAQLYFILGRVKLHWNFSSWLRDGSDIYRLPILHMVKTHFLLENLWISKPSLSILEKFQRSSALPNIKYNCSILYFVSNI